MKKKVFVLAAAAMACANIQSVTAQLSDVKFKFYGRVRMDAFYNSRTNQEMVDGLYYLFPLDKKPDADGKDLNAVSTDYFYTMYTRLGVDINGVELGKAKASVKVEADFRGSGTNFYNLRLRHAYVQLKWHDGDLLFGQTWHPLFGEVSPKVMNLSTGAPFQPFSRAPQLRYRHTFGKFQAIGALVWQSQFLSIGPDNVKSNTYLKNSCVPEIYVGINHRTAHWLLGVGGELLSLKPRTTSTVSDAELAVSNTYKVNERVTSLSGEAYVQYSSDKWLVAAKSVLGGNLTQVNMLGGYGVTSTDSRTGEQEYTPIRNSATWLNIVYGKKWKPGVFVGYSKNLGTSTAVTKVYGLGTNIDQLVNAGAELSYNLPHWIFGVEYTASTAFYGSMNMSNGRVNDTHSVCNHRVVGSASFVF
jgi:hypothetical protein